ncbi:hypothetical protein EDD15DRAFT_2389273 [Pisolithus albus]|nr:hypothetical protein EDD15DRAFT_2389273 [Pisolithus albus]
MRGCSARTHTVARHKVYLSILGNSRGRAAEVTPESSTDQAVFEAYVVDTCTNLERVLRKDQNCRVSVSIGTDYLVKYGRPETLGPEFRNAIVYLRVCKISPVCAPYSPSDALLSRQTHHVYGYGISRIAQPLKWLSEVPRPPDHVTGPLGGGHIRHKFLRTLGPSSFRVPGGVHAESASVLVLLGHPPFAYTMLSPQAQRQWPPVRICSDRRMFMQFDMHLSNFGVDEHGKTVLMDFGDIGCCPNAS